MPADPIAIRVARRHQAALEDVPAMKIRVEYTAGGRISGLDLMTMLDPQVGVVVQLRFRPAPSGPTTTITWNAVTETANVVTGMLVLHAAVFEGGGTKLGRPDCRSGAVTLTASGSVPEAPSTRGRSR